ncbi:MAG TPA: GspH/FimT family pseudopilin [Verrucomicrobiae bacterium]|nr:GspH/FimT family pseudopilin [Verrucomicrobiae bacterium]
MSAKAMNLGGKPTGATRSAFTLIELIIVMTLLIVAISMAAPSLAGFFRGRAVEAEARRLLSLTRLGQSRAVAEGVPMVLWVDVAEKKYGLEEDSSFTEDDTRAVEYKIDDNVTVEIGASDAARAAFTANTLFGSLQSSSKHASLPQIRFQPDGTIDDVSRETFRLKDQNEGSLWLTISSNRMNYEIQSQINLPAAR